MNDLPFELFVAVRYLLARRKQAFISLISFISVIGLMVGVMAVLIALALMTGLQGELRDRIVGASAHVYVFKVGEGITDVRLNVYESNLPAKCLYEAAGYELSAQYPTMRQLRKHGRSVIRVRNVPRIHRVRREVAIRAPLQAPRKVHVSRESHDGGVAHVAFLASARSIGKHEHPR